MKSPCPTPARPGPIHRLQAARSRSFRALRRPAQSVLTGAGGAIGLVVMGAVLELSLLGAAPGAATQTALWLDVGTVKLQGMATPNGTETEAWFEWGTNSSFGKVTPAQAAGSGTAVVHLTHTLPAVLPQTPYWFRLVASNQSGVVYGMTQIACAGKMLTAWGPSDYGVTNVPAGLSNIVMATGGSGHALVLRNDGSVMAWGANFDGQTNIPADLTNLAAISCGYRYNAGLRRNGTLVAWGEGTSGQTNTPPLANVIAVSAGGNYGLALTGDGKVSGWGLTFYGETNFPPGLSNVVQVAAGNTHALALRADGTVAVWGLNDYGQATVPAGLTNVAAVSAGSGFSAVLKRDGTVFAWGINGSGQTSIPAGLSNVIQISCGGAHTMALKDDGTLAVWGHDVYGQTNVPPYMTNVVAVAAANYFFSFATTLNRVPIAHAQTVAGLANIDLAIGLPAEDPDRDPLAWRITALPANGSLYQWTGTGRGPAITAPNALVTDPGGRVIYAPPADATGTNYAAFGYLASDGLLESIVATMTINLLVPSPYVMTHPAAWLAPGNTVLNGMATPNGAVTAAWFEWGTNNTYGNATAAVNIGSGTGVVPVTLPAGGLAAQRAYWCRLVASNRWGITHGPPRLVYAAKNAWSWTFNPLTFGGPLPGLSNIVAAASGGSHALALRDDGTVAAWGDNTYGQTNLAGWLSGIAAVAAGQHFSVVLKTNGTVVAWGGANEGETNVPPGLSDVKLLAAGLYHTLALRRDGTVAAWGENSYGQTNVPAGLSNVVGVAAGSWHSLALKADGSVVGWGSNFGGETNPPAGLPPATQIGAGAGFSAALHENGTITAWGDNSSLQTNTPPGLSNVVGLSTAYIHGFALKTDLSLTAWGSQFMGPAMVLPEGWTNVVDVAAGIARDVALTLNRRPTPLDQHTSGPINLDLTICLSGTDPDNDPLSYKIAVLPARGTLYQFNNGARGPAIGSPGTPVTDAGGRVIFAPATNTYGDDYAAFGFLANDGDLDSSVSASVAIDITVPKPFVATQTAVWYDSATAMLRGAVMPNGLPTLAWFEWSLDKSFGNRAGETNLPPTDQQLYLTGPVAGLGPQVAYWYRLVASNYWGVSYGAPALFCQAKSVVPWGGSYGHTNGLAALSNVVFAAAGNGQSLVVKPDGALLVLGYHNAASAAPPAPLTNIISAAGGAWHSLALSRDGTVTAWGANEYGAINVPAGLSNVVAVAAGNFHNAALRQDGSVAAWGAYGGTVPADLTNAVAVACGFNHSMALTCDGRVYSWGSNSQGQTNVPSGLNKVVAIAARGDHCVALRSNGTVVVWGRGDMGQTNVPPGLANVVAVGSGGYQCMALNDSQRLAVWGWEYTGQTDVLAGLSNVVAITGGPSIGLALALNRAPTAVPGSGTNWANQDLLISLTATDPERDVLSFRIRTLPAAGTLYQCADGARGEPILSPDTPVTDALARVIFAPSPDTFGTNYASFTFTALDSQYESAPSAFAVSVLAAPPQAATMRTTWSGTNSAVFRGMALANGLSTTAWFEWGTDTTYGNVTPLTNAGVLPRVTLLTAPVNNLLPYRVYWCRLVATNLLGVSYGPPQMFCAGKRVYGWGSDTYGQVSGAFLADGLADLSAGRYHSLAAKSDGTPLAWGNNSNNQTAIPTDVTNVVEVAAGTYHSLALQSNGIVRAWGYGGLHETAVPSGLTNAVAIAAGYYNSVALKDDGTAISWGDSSYSYPIVLAPASNLVAIAAGYYHTFGLNSDGRVIPLWDGGWPPTPTNLTDVAAIAAGDNHGLALKRNGTVVAWGYNTANETNVPSGLSNVVAVSAGGNHSLALLRNGQAVAWGSNAAGESTVPASLTNAVHIASGYYFNISAVLNRRPSATGKTVAGIPNQDLVVTLNASDPDSDLLAYRITGLPASGQLYHYRSGSRGDPITAPNTVLTNGAWLIFAPGTNGFGSPYASFAFVASDGEFESNEAQIQVNIVGQPFAATRRAVPVSSTAVNLAGSAVARGLASAAWFEWGTTTAYGQATTLTNLAGGTGMRQLSAPLTGLAIGGVYYCRCVVSNAAGVAYGGPQVFTTGSKAAVWGSYYQGQIFLPPGLGYVTEVAAGATHTVALRRDSTVAAWGFGDYSTGVPKTNTPPGLTNAIAVSAGSYHSAALRRDGTVTVWGGGMYAYNGLTNVPANFTNLTAIAVGGSHLLALRGNGTVSALGPSGSTATNIPAGLSNVVAVAAGNYHSLALRCDGTVVGWGTTPQATVPGGLSNVVAITAGANHSMALKSDGTVVAWGESAYGKTTPPATLSNVVAIAAGANHSAALQANGAFIGWGYASSLTNLPSSLSNLVTIASGGSHNAVLALNRPPTATPQTASGQANHDRVITLMGTDPDLDNLGSAITVLPAQGTLYQYVSGTRGAPVAIPGTVVLDSSNRIIFAPGTNEFGTPYASFGFSVSDGDAVSPPANVTVNIAPLVAPSITACGVTSEGTFQLAFTGDTMTVYCVWTSADLVSWEFMAVASQTSPGQFACIDASATSAPRRFYRISSDCSAPAPTPAGRNETLK